jgi:NifU-like protein involved in Fe-S cluster formation
LRVTDGRVVEARFQTYGCGPSIAASSLVTELVRDRPVEDLGELTPGAVERALGGLPADRRHAATLVIEALRAAAAHYRQTYTPEVSRV